MAPCASRVLLSVNGDKVSVPLHDDEPSTRLIDVLRQHTRYKVRRAVQVLLPTKHMHYQYEH